MIFVPVVVADASLASRSRAMVQQRMSWKENELLSRLSSIRSFFAFAIPFLHEKLSKNPENDPLGVDLLYKFPSLLERLSQRNLSSSLLLLGVSRPSCKRFG